MNPRWAHLLTAALAAGVICFSAAFAQISISEAPAAYRGPYTCPAKFPGSFLDAPSQACWQCPATHPNRTVFIPITVPNACERPAQTVFRKASGPENPTGLLGTDCRSGWFLHWDKKCYSCGSGYSRTADPNIASPRACVRVIPPAWTTAIRRGVEGCPAGAFRNGLTANCYSCPADYSRNAVIADDLTKVNACTRISTSARDETQAKFNASKDSHTASRDNLAGLAGSLGTTDLNSLAFDMAARAAMRAALDAEIAAGTPFTAVTLLGSPSASLFVGYAHGYGNVMAKIGTAYVCKKTWANTFTAGWSVGGGVVLETSLSTGIDDGVTESNGWQAEYVGPSVAGGFGLAWDASDGALSVSFTFGPGFGGKATASGDYTHTWAETGTTVACDKMTWGTGWKTL